MFKFFQKLFQKSDTSCEQETTPAAPEPVDFDFKKEIGKRIREDIRPFLKQNGFKMWKRNHYIRERNGLLQMICFEIRRDKLRTWSSFMPLCIPWLNVVRWGTCSSNVDITLQREDPYAGYNDIWCTDWPPEKVIPDYENITLPKFHALTASIKNAIMPEMDRVSSVDIFLDIVEAEEFLWGNKAFPADDLMIDIIRQTGTNRVKSIKALAVARNFFPDPIYEHVMSTEINKMNDLEADEWFHDYCNRVREHCKLPII